MTQEQLYQIQSAQKQLGDRGEDFALRYERQRLHAHPMVGSIRIIGRTDVGMGYDILSFQGMASQHHDRYIEVKTYSGSPHFFLSESEQAAATRYGTNYCLYLVDVSQLSQPDYAPLIIQDPIHNLDKQWTEKVQSREFIFTSDIVRNLPDDLDSSTVLVGCFNSNEHLCWILHNHAYNVRQGYINGHVVSNEMTETPSYLILYNVREPRTYRIYKITSASIVTKDQMYRMKYPHPHAPSYLLYHLDRQLETMPLDIMQILRNNNDKLSRTSGTPIYLSGAMLRKYILGDPARQGLMPSRTYSNAGRPWSAASSAKLSALYVTGTSIPALAHEFKRPVEEIKMQLHALGITLNHH